MGDTDTLVAWINTCPSISTPISSLADLSDGSALSSILQSVDSVRFENTLLASAGDNVVLRVTAVKQMIDDLESFHRERGVDPEALDVSRSNAEEIVRSADVSSIANLVCLVIGAAFSDEDLSADFSGFLTRVGSLPPTHQGILAEIIQRTRPGDDDDHDHDVPSSPAAEPEGGAEMTHTLTLENEALKEEVQELQGTIADLTGDLAAADSEKERLESLNLDLQAKISSLTDSAESSTSKSDARMMELHTQDLMEEAQRKEVELNMLREQSKEDRARFDQEFRQQADELDTARAQLASMSKLEATLQRYKERVDEMEALKDQLTSLEDTNSEYLERIMDLESEVKAIEPLKAQIDTYKEKTVDLETSTSQYRLEAEMKDSEIAKLKAFRNAAEEEKNTLEQQLSATNRELDALRIASSASLVSESFAAESAGFGSAMTPEVKEELVRLRRENKVLKEGGGAGAGDTAEAAVLKSELEDAVEVKNRLQKAITASQKRCRTLEEELEKLNSAHDKLKAEGGGASAEELETARSQLELLQMERTEYLEDRKATSARIEDLENQVSVSESMKRELKDRLKEEQKTNANLSMDQSKLGTYIRKMSQKTKERLELNKAQHLKIVQQLSAQLEEARANEQIAKDTLRDEKAQLRRESDCIMSAFYNLGVEVQRKLLKPPAVVASSSATSFLGRQRDRSSPLKGLPRPSASDERR